ncbi:hypothetical protein [Aeromonas sp. MR7]|uniref:hypothetical protein n=1 Tax=Aeromonas sp. MR7 TaxID=2923419 RepID=UPI001F4BB34F|nr:hypothetical protein [Aeromonas sp. MR7]MCH7347063.1 hypothetical protein [Aeromonas sp. MR7]
MLAVICYRQQVSVSPAIYQALAAQVGALGQFLKARIGGASAAERRSMAVARQWFDAKWIKRPHMNRKLRRIHPIQSDMPIFQPQLHGLCRQSPTPF